MHYTIHERIMLFVFQLIINLEIYHIVYNADFYLMPLSLSLDKNLEYIFSFIILLNETLQKLWQIYFKRYHIFNNFCLPKVTHWDK